MPILLKDLLQPDQKKAVEYASGLFKDRRSAGAIANTAFHNGDHWQNASGWIGEKPSVLLEGLQIAGIGMEKIRQGFVSENVIKQVDNRHLGGILGREVNWDFLSETLYRLRRRQKPGEPIVEKEQTAKDADEYLTQWWNEGRPKNKLKEAVTISLCEEKALLRLFIPRGLRDVKGGIPVQPKLTDALDFICVDVVYADKGGVFLDTDTQKPFGLYVKKEGESTIAELSWAEKGITFLQRLSDNPKLATQAIPHDLGGRLWMYEMCREPLITEQVRSAQRSINLSRTMMMRNVNLAGNRQTDFLNAERPKVDVKIPDGSANGYRIERRDSSYLKGPGVTNFILGVFIRDKEGNIVDRADPNVSVTEPVPIDTFKGTRAEFYSAILSECQQIHALISEDATASGVSREQARAEFEGSLKLTKEVVDDAGRWMLETALRLAASLCKKEKEYAGLRCDFSAIIQTGPISPEERAQNLAEVVSTPPLMSAETAMSINGREDVDAELARIKNESAERSLGLTPAVPPLPKPANGDSEVVQ